MSRCHSWLKQVITACFVLAAPAAMAELVDGILATVDTEVILYSDVMDDIAPAVRGIQLQVASKEEFDRELQELVRAGLDQAIENKILLREATRAELEVDDDIVEKRLAELKARFPSHEAFFGEIERSGDTVTALRDHLRKQLLARHMAVVKRGDFEKEVVVSEAEVSQYYESHREEFVYPERARCQQIFLAAGAAAQQRALVRARLEELKEELGAGADFAELAAAYSEGPGAEQGGLIGWVQRGDLVSRLEERAFSLPEGGVSDILETAGGLHILKVDRKGEAGLAPLEEARGVIEPELRARAAEERYRKWMAELRKRSRVRVFY